MTRSNLSWATTRVIGRTVFRNETKPFSSQSILEKPRTGSPCLGIKEMRKGITYEEVHNACKALVQRGVNPTIERVRAFLGTGSSGTVNKFLNKYRESLNSPKTNKSYREGYQAAIRDIMRIVGKMKD